jgi:hypothetical protein
MDRRLAAMYGRQFCFRSRQIVYFSICLVRIPPAIHLTENTRLFCPKTVCPLRMILSAAGIFLSVIFHILHAFPKRNIYISPNYGKAMFAAENRQKKL